MTRAARVARGVAASLIAVLSACGDSQPERAQRAVASGEFSGWNAYDNPRRGYSVRFPPGWHRAKRNLTPGITDPVEILSLATFPLRGRDGICGDRGGLLARVQPDGALVTVQERGRGAYGGRDFPERPARFRPDPKLPGHSVWPYCATATGEPPVPMHDYWFGFGDAGRTFHVLVAIGKEAPAKVRDDAFRILNSLRFDPGDARSPSARETPVAGLVAQLPFVGTLRWRCDDRRRFATSLTLPRRGASVFVTVTTEGNRVLTNKQVDPLPTKQRVIETRWATMRRQVWTIRHHHAHATLKVVARMSFSIDPAGGCLVKRTVVRVRRTPQ